MMGVSSGIVSALLYMNFPTPLLAQALMLLASSGALGVYVG